jgi:hypothetical protein
MSVLRRTIAMDMALKLREAPLKTWGRREIIAFMGICAYYLTQSG